MFRKATLAAVAAAMIALTAAPAFAGPAETAFLQKLTNTWSGKGNLQGANSGPIACKIVITGGGKSTKFQGRCNIPDMAQQAFSGSISYNDKTKQYESRSSGSTVPAMLRFVVRKTSLSPLRMPGTTPPAERDSYCLVLSL